MQNPRATKRSKSSLELERKPVISVDQEFEMFSRYLSRLHGGLSTEDYFQLLARMLDQFARMYGSKEAEKAKDVTDGEIRQFNFLANRLQDES